MTAQVIGFLRLRNDPGTAAMSRAQEKQLMQRCCHCQGRFGLVSYRRLSKRFCSKDCRDSYRPNLAAIRELASRWFSTHFAFVAFGHLERPMKVRATRLFHRRSAG